MKSRRSQAGFSWWLAGVTNGDVSATGVAGTSPDNLDPIGFMSDNLSNKRKPARDRINVHEVHEVRYWTNELGISEARLKDLVLQHGPGVKDIRKAWGKD